MPLLSQDNLHKLYIIFLVFYLLFYIGIFLAPFMMNINPDIGLLIYAIYKPICHQLPERSFFIFGHKMAVCARCFGIYTGVLFSSIIYPIVKRLDDFNIPDKKYLILSLLPIAIDGGTQLIGLRESFNILRFITGFLAGSVIVFYIYPIFLRYVYTEVNTMDFEDIKKLAEGKSDKEKLEIYEKFKKNEALAIILSFLFPGLGQLYAGEVNKGILMIVLALIGLFLTIVCIGLLIYVLVWVWSVIDAYQEVKFYNKKLYNIIFSENNKN